MRRVLVPLAISPVLPPRGSVVHALSGRSMGTTWSARIVMEGGANSPTVALQTALDQVVAQMSHWEDDSDLARYNAAAAGTWQQLPADFFKVLRYALSVAQASDGAYDPCAGALVERWGFGARYRHEEEGFMPPSHEQVAELQRRAGWRELQLDERGLRALQPGGVHLDLSSVAKGFAVDQLARCLDARGVHHYLVEAGGELRGSGVKPDGEPWWVELEDVPASEGAIPTVAALHGLALATSGDYLRFYERDGVRAAHTIDPRSGYPVDNGVASVSVLHAECMAADALSTALTVMGPEAGLRFAEQNDIAARFLLRRDGAVHEIASSAFHALLQ